MSEATSKKRLLVGRDKIQYYLHSTSSPHLVDTHGLLDLKDDEGVVVEGRLILKGVREADLEGRLGKVVKGGGEVLDEDRHYHCSDCCAGRGASGCEERSEIG